MLHKLSEYYCNRSCCCCCCCCIGGVASSSAAAAAVSIHHNNSADQGTITCRRKTHLLCHRTKCNKNLNKSIRTLLSRLLRASPAARGSSCLSNRALSWFSCPVVHSFPPLSLSLSHSRSLSLSFLTPDPGYHSSTRRMLMSLLLLVMSKICLIL